MHYATMLLEYKMIIVICTIISDYYLSIINSCTVSILPFTLNVFQFISLMKYLNRVYGLVGEILFLLLLLIIINYNFSVCFY